MTTERTVTVAERLGRALGAAVKVLPYWDELIVEIDGAPVPQLGHASPARWSASSQLRPSIVCICPSQLALSLALSQ